MIEMTDEEKLELVKRCTYLLKVYGRQLPRDRADISQCQYCVGSLAIVANRSEPDPTLIVPLQDQEVIKGSIRLIDGHTLIFSVPHRSKVRPSVLKTYMWPRDDLGAKALVILRNAMVLDDLAGL